MKIFLSGLLLLVFVASCKKQNEEHTCNADMTSIAGNYKITKLEKVSYNTGVATDVTSTLTPCSLSGIYNFRADSTVTYTEATICSGSGTGSWKVENHWLYTLISSSDANQVGLTVIESWDCSNLVVITRFPSVEYNLRFTLMRF